MKFNLAESIREVLMDRQPVSIYGLGTLFLEQIPAQYGPLRQSLMPPTMELRFVEESSTNSYLIQWLAAKYEVSVSDAETVVKMFSEKALNTLLNTGSVTITGVVKMLRNTAEGQIEITPSKDMLTAFYKALPEVELKVPNVPDKTEEEQAIVHEPVSDLTQDLDDTPEDTEQLPEITDSDIDALIAQMQQKANAESTETSEPADPRPDDTGEIFDLESQQTEAEVQALHETLSRMENDIHGDAHHNKTDRINRIWGVVLITFSVLAACFLLFDSCQKYRLKTSTNKDTIATISPAETATAGDVLSENMLTDSETSEVLTQDSCVIITGAFKSLKNIDKMTQSILSNNYQVYRETHGVYTRVGLIFECSNTDLESFIQHIRQEISPRAWYLNPDLYVAYNEN